MKIQVKIQIIDSDSVTHECNIAEFDKGFECAAEIGLSIEDSKRLLLNLQQEIVAAQSKAFCEAHSTCSCCDCKLRSKGSKRIQYRTVLEIFPLRARAFIIARVSRKWR